MTDTETTPMITPSEVIEHIFCPRFTYFMNVLMIPQYEDRRYKVLKGRDVHRRRLSENRDYLRKRLNVVSKEREVYLASPRLGVRGVVDEVLALRDGTMAPLDYKYTSRREHAFRTHQMQVCLYGLLVQEAYHRDVRRAYVVYMRDAGQVLEIPLTEQIKQQALGIVAEIFEIMRTGRLPYRTPFPVRCADCCYKNICA